MALTVLKIDRDARRDDRRAELANVLRLAVWGESTTPITMRRLVAALIRWRAEEGAVDPLGDGIETVAECAAIRLIRKVGGRWVPAPEVHSG